MLARVGERWDYVVLLLAGAYIVRIALTSRTLISEDIPPTEEERRQAKATPRDRLILAVLGTAICLYAAFRIWMG